MKNRIKEYIDLIFADAPDCAKAREMKEEMYANVCDRYDDLVREGKSESAAYNISISGIGDISELIEEIKRENGRNEEKSEYANPYEQKKNERVFTAQEKAEIEKYRLRCGIMNSVAIALYILCWVPLVLIASIAELSGSGMADIGAIIGLVIMMIMIAVATVLMVMKSSIKPLCLKGVRSSELAEDKDDDDDGEIKSEKIRRRKNPILRAINTSLWGITTVVFLALGFSIGAWHPGWMIFIIAVAVENIIEAIFELAGKKYV